MDYFLAIVDEALFYNELSENVEQEIYLYSLLSQYYLEIGADKSGYDTILAGRRLKNFYTIQDPFIRSQALHAYGRFLLPILWVRTQWAIRNQNYAKAIAYYHEYGKVASKFNYIMKKTTLAKELMFALPVSMTNEREQLFNELARDTDVLSQMFLDQYTAARHKSTGLRNCAIGARSMHGSGVLLRQEKNILPS